MAANYRNCGKRRNSHSVFKRLVLQTRKSQGLFRKGLTISKMTHLYSSKLNVFADDKFEYDENGRKG